MENNYYDVTTGKQAELSPLQKMYLELEKIITPRLLDDFCGYNEETQSFDIVLATKEIIEAKEQEYEELRQYHNKCCKENAEKLEQWLEKYNQVSKDFYNGKYCNKENCNLLKIKEQECEALKGENFTFVDFIKTQEELIDKYEQSLDEIEEIANKQRKLVITGKTPLTPVINEVGEDFIDILDIINKAKEK